MEDKVISISDPAWKRPDGPLNVWRIVDGQKKLKDGTKQPIKFSIQEVPVYHYEEAVDFMIKYFLVDEPLCKALNLKDNSDALNDLKNVWNYCLSQGIVEAAYVLNFNGEISELAAINMLFVVSDETESDMDQIIKSFRSENTKKIFSCMGKISKEADARKILAVDKYIGALGLTVSHKYRGQKLGLHMLEVRTEIGRKYEIPASSTVFTARPSQILAERAGYRTELIQNYVDVLNENGKPVFKDIESQDMRVMMRTLN